MTKQISGLTEETTTASGDFAVIRDVSAGGDRKVQLSNLPPAGSITPEKLTSGAGTSWAWQSWTPTWTNLAVSNSTVTAKYSQTGKTVHFRIDVTLAGGDTPSGNIAVDLPVNAHAEEYASTDTANLVNCTYFETGNIAYAGTGIIDAADKMTLRAINITTGNNAYINAGGGNVNATSPFTFGNTDIIAIRGTYEAA